MQYNAVFLALALLLGSAAAEALAGRRLRQDSSNPGPSTETREELRLRRAWHKDLSADPDPAEEHQKHLSREKLPAIPSDHHSTEDSGTASLNMEILDSMEAKSGGDGKTAQDRGDALRRETSLDSEVRQKLDADPKTMARSLKVADQVTAEEQGPGFGDENRQLSDLAKAKRKVQEGSKAGLPTGEKVEAWRPDVDMSLLQEDADPENFVSPCPLDSVLAPDTCQTFITGQHPAIPDPVPCPAIQKACGPGSGSSMMSLQCNGGCCPVCTAPDHVIAIDRHTTVENPDVIPPHPAAPGSCAGVKCFTPLCLSGYAVGHSPGDCCSSCRIAR